MHKHERLAKLIGQGMSPKQAISLVGVSEAYFKRLKDTPDFTALLSSYVNPSLEDEHSPIDEANLLEDKWSALEAQALDTALKQLPFAELKDINKTLDTLSKRKVGASMAHAAHKAADAHIQLVTLSLPEHTRLSILEGQAEVVTTNEGEVIRAGSRDLAPLSTESVASLLEEARPETATLTADDL